MGKKEMESISQAFSGSLIYLEIEYVIVLHVF